MKTLSFSSFKLFFTVCLILTIYGFLSSCYENTIDTPDNKPVLTVEEDLVNKGYKQVFLWTLFEANRAPFELTNLLLEVSGPNSQWGTTAPSLLLSLSTDQGVSWQDSLLVFEKPPIYFRQYAFYYKENKIVNKKDIASVGIYEKQ